MIISQKDFEELTGHKLLVDTEVCTKQQKSDPCAQDCPSFLGCYKFLIYSSLVINAISDTDGSGIILATKILSTTSIDEVKKIIGT